MSAYDFRSLSPHDFELLCRDLLQAEIGVRLESFSAGPDFGIDFRYRDRSVNVIVQCKHYVDSGFDALRRAIERKERNKISQLQPTRYILATSVSLTPMRKDALLRTLDAYCLTSGDILGQEDINNLLAKHQNIEQSHFKLWPRLCWPAPKAFPALPWPGVWVSLTWAVAKAREHGMDWIG